MGFIKAFNWVVDTKNKKVYIKKNSLDQDIKMRYTHLYCAQADGGKLLIRLRTGNNEYAIGDEVTSVNDQPVTSQNICALLKQLNESEDCQVHIVRKVEGNPIRQCRLPDQRLIPISTLGG